MLAWALHRKPSRCFAFATILAGYEISRWGWLRLQELESKHLLNRLTLKLGGGLLYVWSAWSWPLHSLGWSGWLTRKMHAVLSAGIGVQVYIIICMHWVELLGQNPNWWSEMALESSYIARWSWEQSGPGIMRTMDSKEICLGMLQILLMNLITQYYSAKSGTIQLQTMLRRHAPLLAD